MRELPQDEFDEAIKVINGDDMGERFNVTIRWHESHYNGCPYAPLDRDAPLDRGAPCSPGSAPVIKIPDMAAVNKIVGPVAPPPPPEEAVETHRVDTEQATVATAALFRLFTDVTLAVPDWTDHCAALSLLPSRASQNHDYEVLKSLREHQARYVDLLITTKDNYFDEATELDLESVKHMLRRESQKLSLLEARLEIYETVLQQVAQVAFNEQRLATNNNNNDTNVRRAVVTFKQAKMLVDAVLREEIAKNERLIVDSSKSAPGATHANAT